MKNEILVVFATLLMIGTIFSGMIPKTVEADVFEDNENNRGNTGCRPYYYYIGDMVCSANGNLYISEKDISIRGRGFDIEVIRSYNSHSSGLPGPFGFGWTYNYNMKLEESSQGYVHFFDQDGAFFNFTSSGGGHYVSPPGIQSRLTKNLDGLFTLWEKNGNKYSFNSTGILMNITDKNGNTLTFSYLDGNLISVADDSGMELSFLYDDLDRIIEVVDPIGRQISYNYSVNDLINVTDAMGNSTLYFYYGNHKMGCMIDRVEGMTLFNYYDENRTNRVKNIKKSVYYRANNTYITPFTILTLVYDDVNNIVHETDGLGNTTSIYLNDYGNPERMKYPLGVNCYMDWNSNMDLIMSKDPNGNIYNYNYDSFGNLITEIDPLGGIKSNQWKCIDNTTQYLSLLTNETNVLGYTTSYVYDDFGNLVELIDSTGNTSHFQYDSHGNIIKVFDFNDAITNYTYNSQGLLINLADPMGNSTYYTYDTVGRLLSIKNPKQFTTTNFYNDNDWIIKKIDALGNETLFFYNAEGTNICTIDANGHKTIKKNNLFGKTQEIQDPSGNKTSSKYDKNGNLIKYTSAENINIKNEYDALGRIINVTDNFGYSIHYEYDPNGNIISETDKLGSTTFYNYDALNRLTKIKDPIGFTVEYIYDALGNIISYKDKNGCIKNYTFDPLNRLISKEDALGGIIKYFYDPMGNVVSIKDQNGYTTNFSYDKLNRRIKIISPLFNTTHFNHDSVGNIIKRIDANGNITSYEYDGLDRLFLTQYQDGSGVRRKYDAVGNLIQIQNIGIGLNIKKGMFYDELDRVILEYENFGLFNSSMGFSYDGDGRRINLNDFDQGLTSYEYDNAGRIIKLTNPYGEKFSYEYDANGRRIKMVFPNDVTASYLYNELNSVSSIIYQKNNGDVLNEYLYEYDPNGNVINITENDNNWTCYSYDKLNRIVNTTYSSGEFLEYTYDPVGNRLSERNASGQIFYSYDAENKLMTAGDIIYKYDNNGNMIIKNSSSMITSYKYDYEDRLKEIFLSNGNNIDYLYSPDGKRIAKINSTITQYYIYDNDEILKQTNQTGFISKYFTNGIFIDDHLGMSVNDESYFYHSDYLGNVKFLTNDNDNVVTSYNYRPFGTVFDSFGDVENNYRFNNREYDSESNLYYYRSRFYNSDIGRFITKDKYLDLNNNLNLYNYVQNNPLNFIDPHGLVPIGFSVFQGFMEFNKKIMSDVGQGINNLWNNKLAVGAQLANVGLSIGEMALGFHNPIFLIHGALGLAGGLANIWLIAGGREPYFRGGSDVLITFLYKNRIPDKDLELLRETGSLIDILIPLMMLQMFTNPHFIVSRGFHLVKGFWNTAGNLERGAKVLKYLVSIKSSLQKLGLWDDIINSLGISDQSSGNEVNSIEGTQIKPSPVPSRPGFVFRPDDNYDVSLLDYEYCQNEFNYAQEVDIAILKNGFYTGMTKLLDEFETNDNIFRKSYTLLDINVQQETLNDYPVFIIPSGGLFGIDTLLSFKNKLKDYVENGGTLIVFAQQLGNQYKAIPGGIFGRGWDEIDFCFLRSVWINTYNQILCSLDKIVGDINIDGEFTSYPENTTILLSKIQTGKPAMIMYHYGNGTVIATTAYIDWIKETSFGGPNLQEKNLVNSLIKWAKKSESIPEYGSNKTISLTVNITSYVQLTTNQVVLIVKDPTQKIIESRNYTLSVLPYEEKNINFTYTTPNKTGIYHIDYQLLDDNLSFVQHIHNIQSFTVSNYKENPDGWVVRNADITFSITLPYNYYVYGSMVPFTVQVINHGNSPRTICANIYYKDARMIDVFLPYRITRTLNIPATGNTSFTSLLKVDTISLSRNQLTIYGDFYNFSLYVDNLLGKTSKTVYLEQPSIGIHVETTNPMYLKGGNVSINVTTTNMRNALCSPMTIIARIFDPDNLKVYETSWTNTLNPFETKINVINYLIPTTSKKGNYRVTIDGQLNKKSIGSGSTTFEVVKDLSFIITSPTENYLYGNQIPLTIFVYNPTNLDRTITYQTYYKDGSYSSVLSQQNVQGELNVQAQGNASITYLLDVGQTLLSNNRLIIYADFYESGLFVITQAKSVYIWQPAVDVQTKTNKTTYLNGENVTVNITTTNWKNAICSPTTIMAKILSPDNQKIFESSWATSFNPYETKIQQIHYFLPASLRNGVYLVTVEEFYNSKKITTSSTIFEVLKPYSSKLIFEKPERIYKVRDHLNMSLEVINIAFIIWNGTINVTIPHLSYNDSIAISINPHQTQILHYTIPISETTPPGTYILSIEINEYTETYNFVIPTSQLQLNIEKTQYNASDSVNITLSNTGGVDTDCNYSMNLFDSKGLAINENLSGTIHDIFAGGQHTIGFALPDQAVSGEYYLWVICLDLFTNTSTYLIKCITVKGLKTTINISTNKICYFRDEPKSVTTHIVNLDGNITNSTLHHRIFLSSATPEKGLVGYWSFKEGTGFIAHDSSGNNNDGIISSSAQWVNGTSGFALRFPTYDSMVGEIPESFDDSFSTGITISAWVRWESWTGRNCVIFDGTMNGTGLVLYLNPSGTIKFSPYGWYSQSVTGPNLTPGKWTHVTGLFDYNAQIMQLYIDGNLVNSANAVSPYYQTYIPATIGNRNWGGIQFNGIIDEVRIYNQTLSQGEIQSLFSGGGLRILVWEASEVMNISEGTSLTLTNNIPLHNAGKYQLESTLESVRSQVIAEDSTNFYVYEENTSLILTTDKEMNKPGELITIHGEVTNYADIPDDYELIITINGTTIYSLNFSLNPHQSKDFNTTTRQNSSFRLVGKVDDVLIEEYITVEKPDINLSMIAPYVVGLEPFEIAILVENIKNISADVTIHVLNNSWHIILPANRLLLFVTNYTIRHNTTLNVTITGDVNRTIQKEIVFGEDTNIEFTGLSLHPEGLVEIPFIIRNTGFIDTSFNATFSIYNQTIKRSYYIPKGQNISDIVTFNLSRGLYLLTYNSPLEQKTIEIHVLAVHSPPEFITIEILPMNMNFTLGQNVTITFVVTNIGGSRGEATIKLLMPDFEDTNTTWIDPGEEPNISFNVTLPTDLMEKSYKAEYELNGKTEEFSFFLQGVNVEINASLDKYLYAKNENAEFTINLTNKCSYDLSMFARVQIDDYEEIQYFNLSNYITLQFHVPVQFNDKLFYGIYLDTGRAIYLNSMYLYKKEWVTLYTDKQVYSIGDTVTIFVNTPQIGNLHITAPGFNITEIIEGDHIFSFTVPELRSDNYSIAYTFDNFSSTYSFDVAGYSAKIIECNLDKEVYNLTDVITTRMTMEVNQNISGELQMRIYDSQYNIIDSFMINKTFMKGENQIEISRNFTTKIPGLHILVYELFAHSDLLFLGSGAEYFDVPQFDTTPPLTNKTIGAPQYFNGLWVTSYTEFNLTTENSHTGSDSDKIYYRISFNNEWTSWVEYSQNFTLSNDGVHFLEYYSVDYLGNIEETHNQTHYVDDTTPVTAKTVSMPKHGVNDQWVTSSTKFNLTASDTIDGSGIDTINYRFWYNGLWSPWITYSANFTLFRQGLHYLEYYSIDHLGNTEMIHNQTHYVDDTPPSTSCSLSGTLGQNAWYTNNVTVTLTATDTQSGVNNTSYRIDGGSWQNYATMFNLTSDGTHLIEYYSTDMLGNTENIQSVTLKIDKTLPALNITKPEIGYLYICDKKMTYVGQTIAIKGITVKVNSSDPVSGIAKVEFYIDNKLKSTDNTAPYEWKWNEKIYCKHKLKTVAYDQAGNTKTVERDVWVFNC